MFKYTSLLCSLTLLATTSYAGIHYPNVSHSKQSQVLFDKGMLSYYAYQYAQAEATFSEAVKLDSQCAMCHWGLAISKKQQAIEQNQSFASLGFDNIMAAQSLSTTQSGFYNDLIQATKVSFSPDPQAGPQELHTQYINELRKLNKKYQSSPQWREEALALLTDAMGYYSSVPSANAMSTNHCSNMSSNQYKEEAKELLAHALQDKNYRDHPGLFHTYIHLAERDVNDSLGLAVAQKLPSYSDETIAHYTHMPTHIYWRRGMYDESIMSNLSAIAIDDDYFKNHGVGYNTYYYEYHYLHSHHFLSVLGVLTNNFELAIQYARTIKSNMHTDRMSNTPDDRDAFLSLEHLVLARFNKWNEVLALSVPAGSGELAELMIQFSQALAHLHLGNEYEFNSLYEHIKQQKHEKPKLVMVQNVALTYLEASKMHQNNASLQDIELLFSSKKVAADEAVISTNNPPLWFFPHQLFLADAALEKGDLGAEKSHRLEFQKVFPKSTLHNNS